MKFDKQTETHLLDSIKRFFAQEMDTDIGDLKALRVLAFFTEEIGPSVYNTSLKGDDDRGTQAFRSSGVCGRHRGNRTVPAGACRRHAVG